MNHSPFRSCALAAMVLAAALSRLVPHPPSFTPVFAMALFGGAYFGSRWVALAVPLLAMVSSDLVLAMLVYDWGIFATVPAMYVGAALTVWIGRRLKASAGTLRVAGAAVLAAIAYFLLTNLAVWLGGRLYPQTFEGLVACYVAALPFFKNLLLGNLVFAAALFGGLAMVERKITALREIAPQRAG